MSVPVQTTAEVSENIVTKLEGSLNQEIPLLPKAFIRVLAKVLAAVYVQLHKYGSWIFLQQYADTASAKEVSILGFKFIPLVRLGRRIGVSDPVAATNAELTIEITVENQVGTLASNQLLTSSKNGFTYMTIGALQLDAATKQVTVRAVDDQVNGTGSGSLGNLDADDVLAFINPLPNVAREAVVIAQTVTAADAEDLEVVYRGRVRDAEQKPPQGGALTDYEIWGEETAGIIAVYPYTGDPGQMNVYSEATEASSGSPDGIPTGAQLTAVKASIEKTISGKASRRPPSAFINSLPISRSLFDVMIFDLEVANEVEVKADITAAVDQLFREFEPFIDGLTVGARNDRITKNDVISTVQDIVKAANGTFASLSIKLNTIDVEVYTLGEGEKAKATVGFA